jgi:hypothetical protein
VQDGGEPSVAVPYCSAKAKARDDYTSANAGSSKVVPVLDNDTRSEGTCADTTVEVIDVSETVYGGTVDIVTDNPALCGAASSCVVYTPPAGKCNIVDSFDYTALLGGGDSDTAKVFVTVTCGCGNGVVDPGEDCDKALTPLTCSSTCENIASLKAWKPATTATNCRATAARGTAASRVAATAPSIRTRLATMATR